MDETVGVGVGPAERARHAGGDGPTPEPRRRMSARRKLEAVLRLLRGEDLELVSRELGVTAAELSGWRDRFLAGGEAPLESRPAEVGGHSPGGKKRAFGDAPPFGPPEAETKSRQVSPSTDLAIHQFGLE